MLRYAGDTVHHLNGPQVIEQEAGIDEYDSRNRPFIWSLTGGEARERNGFVDKLVDDSLAAVKAATVECMEKGKPASLRNERYDEFLPRLNAFDTRQQADAKLTAELFAKGNRS